MGGGDAEEGSERGVPGAAPVEAEDELVEIGLKVFAAQAVVDAVHAFIEACVPPRRCPRVSEFGQFLSRRSRNQKG